MFSYTLTILLLLILTPSDLDTEPHGDPHYNIPPTKFSSPHASARQTRTIYEARGGGKREWNTLRYKVGARSSLKPRTRDSNISHRVISELCLTDKMRFELTRCFYIRRLAIGYTSPFAACPCWLVNYYYYNY